MRRFRVSGLCVVFLCLLASLALGQTIETIFSDYTGETAYDVVVGDGYAYVSNNGGISIYDIRDPENLALLTHPQWAGGSVFGLDLAGSILYAAAAGQGFLLIADVSDPAAPVILTRYGSGAGIVYVHNEVAYVGGYGRTLELVDVSTPAQPSHLLDLGFTGASGVAGIGDYVFITDPARGVVQFDMTDPTNPVELGVLRNTWSAYKLEIRNDTLHIARYSQGILVFSLSNPRYPVGAFSFPHSGEAWDVSGSYPILCVADLQEGVEVIDASAPYSSRMAAVDTSYAPHAIEYADGYIHLADQDEGYVLLRLVLDDESGR
ncbi:LVIVD repeat-containing protein [Candidatus Bipolaricaulota bacterium]